MKSRAIRRFQRNRVIQKRIRIAKEEWLLDGESLEKYNWFEPGKFSKRSNGCGCRRKKFGQPKVWTGMCKIHGSISRRKQNEREIDFDIEANSDNIDMERGENPSS